MSFFDIHITNSVVKIDNHFEGTFKQRNDEKTENQDCEDVDSEPVHDTSSNQHTEPVKETATPQQPLSNVPPTTMKDFSHSPLIAYMTYPEHANYLLGHLHQQMEKQKTARGRILYLKAVCEVGLFKSRIPYTAYVIEFGKNMSQSNYSRLMGNGGKYTNDEITLALETIDLSVFKSKNKA